MAHVRKDTLTKTREWWKHLRPFGKRRQAKGERIAAKDLIKEAVRQPDDWAGGGPF